MKSEVSGAFSSAIGLLRFGVADGVAPNPVGPVGPAGQVLYFAAFAAERTPGGVDRLLPAEHTPVLIRRDGHEFYSIGAGGWRLGSDFYAPSRAWWRTSRADTMKI